MRAMARSATAIMGAFALTAITTTAVAQADEKQAGQGDPGIAASCPSIQDPTIQGGKAHWEIQCIPDGIKVFGWVEDTGLDNHGACLNGYAPTGEGFGQPAHGWGVRTGFDLLYYNTNSIAITLSSC